MTCILAIKSPKVLKWHQTVVRAILYHPVQQYLSNLIFSFKNITAVLQL